MDDVLSDPDYVHDPTDEEFYTGYDSAGDQYIYITEVLPIGDVRGRSRDSERQGSPRLIGWKLRRLGRRQT